MIDYQVYIRSLDWYRNAAPVKKRAHYRCEYIYFDGTRCRNKSGLQIHHLNYERLGYEGQDDLMYVCKEHHLYLDVERKLIITKRKGRTLTQDDFNEIAKKHGATFREMFDSFLAVNKEYTTCMMQLEKLDDNPKYNSELQDRMISSLDIVGSHLWREVRTS